jgi:hypothetical protein
MEPAELWGLDPTVDFLNLALGARDRICAALGLEPPVPDARRRVIRVSAASYIRSEQYERLAAALVEELDAERRAGRATLSAR